MSKSTYPLKLPNSVKEAAAELAKIDGVSLNQFIASAVAEKVGTLRTANAFLQQRAGSVKPKDLIKFLRRAPRSPLSREMKGSRSWHRRRGRVRSRCVPILHIDATPSTRVFNEVTLSGFQRSVKFSPKT